MFFRFLARSCEVKTLRYTVGVMLAWLAVVPLASAQQTTAEVPDTLDQATIDYLMDQPLNWMFGMNFMVVNPQDSLRSAYQSLDAPSVGYGLGFDVAYYFDPIPLAITGQFAVNFMGSGSYQRSEYRLESQNVHIPVTVGVRFQPNLMNTFFPYVEGVGGFSLFSTSAEVRPTRVDQNTTFTGPQPETNASWTYGIGAGVMVTLANIITIPDEVERVAIDVRFRYLRNTDVAIPAFQLDAGSYTIEQVLVPSPRMVMFNLGVIGHF